MTPFPYCKLEIFVPASHLEAVAQTLGQKDAGHIGQYDRCLSYSPVTSRWRPLGGTHPYLGSPGQISQEEEFKIEVTCPTAQAADTVAAIKAIHPYEEPVINVIPLLGVGL